MTQIERRVYSPALDAELKRLAESEDLYKDTKPKAMNIMGRRFGRLVVVRPVGHGSQGRLKVLVHCDCGDSKIMIYDGLNAGTKSCGCLQTEKQLGIKAAQYQLMFRRMIRERKIGPAQADDDNLNSDITEHDANHGLNPLTSHEPERPSVNTTKGRRLVLESFVLPELPEGLRKFREKEEERIWKDKERIENSVRKSKELMDSTPQLDPAYNDLAAMHAAAGLPYRQPLLGERQPKRVSNWRDKKKENDEWRTNPNNVLNQQPNPFMDALNSMSKISHNKESSNDDDN